MPAHLGQHFLIAESYQRRILDALRLTGSETVLEIGPGKGAMTDLLAGRVARLVAVEVDPMLAADLRSRYADNPKVEIVENDILRTPLDTLPAPTRVFGNLPYYITSPILLRLFEHAAQFDRLIVMVQREVAERITADPGSRDYGFLTVTAHYYSDPRLLFTIPPGAFRPPPRVHSSVLEMKIVPRRLQDEAGFFRMVRAAFSQKRKTLLNNLKPLYGVDAAREAISKAGVAPAARGEELTLDQFIQLFFLLRGGN